MSLFTLVISRRQGTLSTIIQSGYVIKGSRKVELRLSRSFGAESYKTCRYRNTFLPTSVRLLNAKSGRGNLSGRMGGGGGGYNGAHYFPTTLHCHYCHYLLCYVVLCKYLPQEFLLWGTITGYCIVLFLSYQVLVFSFKQWFLTGVTILWFFASVLCQVLHRAGVSEHIK